MVIVPVLHLGGRGSIPGRVEMLGSVSVNHRCNAPKCKYGTSECGEDRFECSGPSGMWIVAVQSPQIDCSRQGWVSSLLKSFHGEQL